MPGIVLGDVFHKIKQERGKNDYSKYNSNIVLICTYTEFKKKRAKGSIDRLIHYFTVSWL